MYGWLDVSALEARIRKLGRQRDNAELVTGRTWGGGWRAGLKGLGAAAQDRVIMRSCEGPDKRAALEHLLGDLESNPRTVRRQAMR
jgi:hypothetical protein